jgi:hypothetical protein
VLTCGVPGGSAGVWLIHPQASTEKIMVKIRSVPFILEDDFSGYYKFVKHA